jgi:hypothetical protein
VDLRCHLEGRSKMWIGANLPWTKQIGEFFRLVVAEMCAHNVMKFFFSEKRTSRLPQRCQTVRTVFHAMDVRSLRPSRSAIHHHVLSNLLQKNEKRQSYKRMKSVKGPVGVSTTDTSMPKLKSKRNIMFRRTINQYVKSFMIMRENMHCTSLRGLFIG